MIDTVTRRVARGFAHQDQLAPGWWREDAEHPIDVDRLDLADACRCVLGQRYDGHPDANPDEDGRTPYDVGLRDLFPDLSDRGRVRAAIRHGYTGRAGDFAALTAEWRRGILARRGGEGR